MANKKTTKHALQRLKSRQGINKPLVAEDLVQEVLNNGVRVKDLPAGDVRDYLMQKYKTNTQRKRTYLYNDYLYIFSNNKVLITTYKFEMKERRNYGE